MKSYLKRAAPKSEALRQVQIAFISGKLTNTDAQALDRAGARLYIPGQLPHGSFAHPYYWAPFILIGNSL
jgi:CHAT domain-containing protein